MIKRFVITVMLLACSSLSHPSAATEEFSMVAERATRNYQEMLDVREDKQNTQDG